MHFIKVYGGMEVQLQLFSAWSLEGGKWSASFSNSITPRKRVIVTHCIGNWVGPRASLDALEKRQYLIPARNQTRFLRPTGNSILTL
jgi:hypothetical protein